MTQPFIGEIQVFGFNFAPYQWAQCNGATLAIQQNTALFSLIGTLYGGNGTSTFQLPNLAAQAACSQGQGPGLSQRDVGEAFGVDSLTLLTTEMPVHTHGFTEYNQPDTSKRTNKPSSGNALIIPFSTSPFPAVGTKPNTTFSPQMLNPNGQNQPHENRQPALALNYCIALYGVFPSFS
ncbi:microcystin-dependent protein [Dyella monticola]|uniref:Microcystin-dependent protein n=1 Tax=Dyella monticola TaxID=1927958 RepID=A0A370X091_9GAMM|nr:tail fiber protein [Dyella monticola]RDS81681.1 microcystin-dependent protein [Dyella monticola]